ncbi:hypothetical protein Anas_10098 [Armadillidium nasatum]|uniref:Uncharacterized protein n=1 Tax=Armadillidium nasatum TaxID=96803 RepID=A0A5N5TCB3_9CRUS|nr:hypothetical protein Anas_10098 [Armadillidium nasatum]
MLAKASSEASANFHDDPVWNIRHVLPELNLENNSVTDVYYNVGDAAFLPCRFPQYSRHHEK